jgi:two-component system sensor histidine kinase DesK
MLMLLLRDLRQRNDELTAARAELARMAVAAERERFARDLHDLLGHTLSVITLKAELAGRLLPGRPDDAAREVADLEGVARAALSEVRETVSGYRQPTLERELAGAKMALAAARIDAQVESAIGALDPAAEAVLAWTVREGATNVIRHSGARRCRISLGCADGEARVEIADDGNGTAAATGGNGLAGLRERALAVGGVLEAGVGSDGGFHLVARVPVLAAGASAVAPAPLPGLGRT